MVKDFEGQAYWGVILGGSAGLGLASAKELARHGMNICIVHRDRRSTMADIERSFEEIRSYGVKLLTFNRDGLSSKERKGMIQELTTEMGEKGRVRTLVHSIAKGNLKAMVNERSPTLQNEDFHLTIEAMSISLYDWTQALATAKLFASDARVLSFTSEGSSKALPHYAAVSAAKASLEAISRSIALEYAHLGIRANCIQAGVTDTASLRAIPGSDRLKEQGVSRNPFKRLTTPEDVAKVVYLLSKDEAAWINGAIIPVDGGESIGG